VEIFYAVNMILLLTVGR